jgi:autotransporter-associated beta strand protein
MQLGGVNTYTGGTTLTSPVVLSIVGSGSLGSGTYAGAFTISSGSTFTWNSSASQTLSSTFTASGGTFNVNGTGPLTLAGSGDNNSLGATVNTGAKLILAKINSASGHALGAATTVNNGGTLQLGGTGGDQIYDGVTITIASGGVFDLNSQTEAFTTLNLSGTGISSGGALINSSGASTLTCSSGIVLGADSSIGGSGSIALPSVISGSHALTYTGTGTFTPTGANTYTGGTTVSGGACLSITADSALGGSSGSVTLNNGSLKNNNSATSVGSGRTITLGSSGGYFDAGWSLALTISSPITGSGQLNVNLDGGSYVVLVNTGNNYTGNTVIGAQGPGWFSGGSLAGLQLGASGVIPNGSTYGNVTVNGGAGYLGQLDINGKTQTINGLSGSGTVNNSTGTGSLSVGNNAQSSTFSGVIENTGGTLALTKVGSGTLTLSGANTYTGGTTLSGGTLYGSAAGSIPGNVTVSAGTLELGTTTTMSSSATLNLPASPSAGQVNLNFSGTQNITAMNWGATSMAQGTWGASGAAHNNAAFTGTGLINVTSGGTAQTITFPNPGTQTYGVAPITLTATAPGGTVTYTVTSGPATVAGSTLTITGAGSVIVQANQAGTTTYNAAPANNQTFTVSARAVTLAGNPNKIYDGTTGVAGVDLKVTNPVGSDVVTVTGTGSSGDLAGSGFGVQTISSTAGLSLGGAQAANYTLTGASGSVTITAGDTGCNDAIANGNNGGTGFMAWANVSDASPGGTYNNGASPAGDLCVNGAWGLYTGTGAGPASAQRPLANSDSLAVNQSIRVDMQNSASLATGGSEGLSLYNSSGATVFELYFSGGATYWTIHDNSGTSASTIPYASSGMRAIFTLVTATTYSLTVQEPIGGTTYGPFTGTLISGTPPITQLRFYTYNIGNGNNLQFNDLAVGCPAFTVTTEPSPSTVCAGSTASFTAASTSASSPTFQWQVSTDGGSTWNSVSTGTGGTTASYTTAATTTGMNGYEYRCVVTDGCSIAVNSSAATLTVNAIPSTPTASNNGPVCTGTTLSLSTPTVSGATYSWTGPLSFASSAQNPTVSTGATTAMAGTYNVTVSVSGCTSAAGSTTVTVNSTPATPGTITQANPSGSSVCSGASGVTYTISAVSGATTYIWTVPSGASVTAGAGTTSITVNWGTAASGSVQVSAGNTCGTSAAASLAVTVNSTPATPGTITQASPSGSSVCANASGVTYSISAVSGATTYTWTVPSGASITVGSGTTSITVNWGTATSGNVTVTAGNTCGTSSASTLSVTVDPGPTGLTVSIAPSSSVCAGSPATFSVSTASGSPSGYAWRKRDTTAGWGTGNNWVFTYNSSGCDSYNGVFIGSATASGQSPGINNSGQAFGLYANTYNSAEAKRSFGSLSIGQNISFDMQIPVTLTGNDGSGHNSQALFALRNSANEGNPRLEIWVLAGASYVTISDGTGDESATVPYNVNGYHCVFKLTGNNTYNLTVTLLDGSGGPYAFTGRSLKGTPNDPVNQVRAWLKNYDSTQGSNDRNFYVNNIVAGAYEDNASNYSAGGCASTTWTTSPNLGFGPVSSSASYVISSPATTDSGSYDVLVWDSCGQAFASPATLTVNAIPSTPTAGNNGPVCTGTSLSLSTPTVTEATYSWTGPISFTSSAQNPTVSTSATTAMAGTYYITVTVNGCTSIAGSTAVTVNPLPTVSVNSATICAGGSATLTATTSAGSPSYLWSPGGATTASITVSPSSTITYTVTVTDGTTSCANSGSGTVTVDPLPTVSVNSATICAGASATLTATTSASSPSYLWSPGGATTASITVSPASTTTYTVTVTDGTTSCANSGSGTVTVNALPVAPSPNLSSNLAQHLSMKVAIVPLLAAWTSPGGSPLSVASAGPSSGQGGTVSKDSNYIYYLPPSGTPATDTIPYTVSDANGCTTAGTLDVNFVTSAGYAQSITYSGGAVTINFAGIPGYQYEVERSSDSSFTSPEVVLTTNAPTAGLFIYTDNSPPQPSAYYRMKY